MIKPIKILFLTATLSLSYAGVSHAVAPYLCPAYRAETTNWHANYAHSAYGYPLALVVPPTAQL